MNRYAYHKAIGTKTNSQPGYSQQRCWPREVPWIHKAEQNLCLVALLTTAVRNGPSLAQEVTRCVSLAKFYYVVCEANAKGSENIGVVRGL